MQEHGTSHGLMCLFPARHGLLDFLVSPKRCHAFLVAPSHVWHKPSACPLQRHLCAPLATAINGKEQVKYLASGAQGTCFLYLGCYLSPLPGLHVRPSSQI